MFKTLFLSPAAHFFVSQMLIELFLTLTVYGTNLPLTIRAFTSVINNYISWALYSRLQQNKITSHYYHGSCTTCNNSKKCITLQIYKPGKQWI